MPEGGLPVGVAVILIAEETNEEAVKADMGRGSLRFQTPLANTANVYIHHKRTVAIAGVNMGIEMPPGTLVSMNKHDDKDIDASWYAIAAAAAQTIIVMPVEQS